MTACKQRAAFALITIFTLSFHFVLQNENIRIGCTTQRLLSNMADVV